MAAIERIRDFGTRKIYRTGNVNVIALPSGLAEEDIDFPYDHGEVRVEFREPECELVLVPKGDSR